MTVKETPLTQRDRATRFPYVS